jgi:flagellar biosynthesis regulator FlaF
MKINVNANNDGSSLWSGVKRETKIYDLDVSRYDDGEDDTYIHLEAFFTKRTWDTSRHGLIYTDNNWIREFRKGLISLGLTPGAARAIDYTEQGMQGDNYVSLSCGGKKPVADLKKFLKITD